MQTVYMHICICAKEKEECQATEQLTVIIQLFVTFTSVLLLAKEIPYMCQFFISFITHRILRTAASFVWAGMQFADG